MSTKRKLWSTQFAHRARLRHQSQAAAYRYIQEKAADWRAGLLDFQRVTVYVDTREGFGWQTYEHIDLDEVARATSTPEETR